MTDKEYIKNLLLYIRPSKEEMKMRPQEEVDRLIYEKGTSAELTYAESCREIEKDKPIYIHPNERKKLI